MTESFPHRSLKLTGPREIRGSEGTIPTIGRGSKFLGRPEYWTLTMRHVRLQPYQCALLLEETLYCMKNIHIQEKNTVVFTIISCGNVIIQVTLYIVEIYSNLNVTILVGPRLGEPGIEVSQDRGSKPVLYTSTDETSYHLWYCKCTLRLCYSILIAHPKKTVDDRLDIISGGSIDRCCFIAPEGEG